jgi:hypothetical protein
MQCKCGFYIFRLMAQNFVNADISASFYFGRNFIFGV